MCARRIHPGASPFDGQSDLLARDVVLRIRAALLSQDETAARGFTTRIAIPVAPDADAATRAHLDALAHAVLDDPRVAMHRERLAAPNRAAAAAPDLVATVEDALRRGEQSVVDELGSRAVPALVTLLHPEWDVDGAVAGYRRDPAAWLALLDPTTALTVFSDLMDAGRFARPERIIDAFYGSGMTRHDGTWFEAPGGMPRFLAPDWLSLIERCVEAGVSGGDDVSVLSGMLEKLVKFDALPPGLARAIGEAALLSDRKAALALVRVQQDPGRRPSLVPLLETALEHSADAVRVHCATLLAEYPSSRALRRHGDDPAPRVRTQLARSLRPISVHDPVYHGLNVMMGTVLVTTVPVIDAEARDILSRLARDVDPMVRTEATLSILALDAPLGRDVYLSLARDPVVDVRLSLTRLARGDALPEVLALLARDENLTVRYELAGRAFDDLPTDDAAARNAAVDVLHVLAQDADTAVRQRAVTNLVQREATLPASLVAGLLADKDPAVRRTLARDAASGTLPLLDVLTTLASDADPSVRAEVDERLRQEVGRQRWTQHGIEAFLSLLESRVFAAADPSSAWRSTVTQVLRHGEGVLIITRWALARPQSTWLWQVLIEYGTNNEVVDSWFDLEDDEFVRLVEALDASPITQERVRSNGHDPVSQIIGRISSRAARSQDVRIEACRELLARAVLPAPRRVSLLWALSPVLEIGDVDLAVGVIADGWWHTTPPSGSSLANAQAIALRPPVANAFVSALLARDDIEPTLLIAAANAYAIDGPDGEALTARILERWFGPTPHPAVAKAVSALGTWPDAADPSLLEDALFGAYPESALDAMNRTKEPEHLHVLARFVRTFPFQPGGGNVLRAVGVIESHLNDAAVDVLLQLAGSGDAHLRARCMQAVQSIQDYLLARKTWERRMAEGRTRDDAVAELLGLLDGDDALLRAESVRALGILGAVEQMPRVIALLRDEDPSVAAAAREALDRLHAFAADGD